MAFAFTAMDQIVNQMAKVHYMLGGQAQFPLVLRASTGGGRAAAAQHCQSSHPFFLNLPGLKVVMPSTPSDAKGLMKTAIRDNNPVVFFEPQGYGIAGLTGPVPEDEYTIPIGAADVKRPGSDATIVAIGHMVQESLSAADFLAEGHGVSAEVVDPRTLVPLDRPTLQESVMKTGRLVVVDEASSTGSAAAENHRRRHRVRRLLRPESSSPPRVRSRCPQSRTAPPWSCTASPAPRTSSPPFSNWSGGKPFPSAAPWSLCPPPRRFCPLLTGTGCRGRIVSN